MISPKTIRFDAYRGTSADSHTIFRGGVVRFIATLDESIDLTGCEFLRLDIRASATDQDAPLASVSVMSPTGTEIEFEFSTAQTNHDIGSGWLVLYGYYPEGIGDTDDNIDPLHIAELTLVLHNSSILAPDPPELSVLPTGVFKTIAVSGESSVVADSLSDTLTLVEGDNITITTNATNDSITISSTGGAGPGAVDWGDIGGDISDQSDLQAALNNQNNLSIAYAIAL